MRDAIADLAAEYSVILIPSGSPPNTRATRADGLVVLRSTLGGGDTVRSALSPTAE